MDASRLDTIIRSLTSHSSRRGVLAGLASGLLAVLPLALNGDDAEARKKRRRTKKPSLNAFGCVNVGKACGGSDGRCCSGICEGEKPRKGKKDTSHCVPHNTSNCTGALNICTDGPASKCGAAGADAYCMITTGNASFCGNIDAFDPEINCRPCGKDTDCEAMTGPGSACVVIDVGQYCTGATSCKSHGSSKGTACVPAGA